MARPIKSGMDYFPVDVDMDQDDKIYCIKTICGLSGLAVLFLLLMEVYRNGYFLKWMERERLIFASKKGIDLKLLDMVLEEALKQKFFDQQIFEQYQILTSRGIQKRYFLGTKRWKGKTIFKEICCIDSQDPIFSEVVFVSAPETLVNAAETGVNVTETLVNAAKTGVSATCSNLISSNLISSNLDAETGVNVTETLTDKNPIYLPLAQLLVEKHRKIDPAFIPKEKEKRTLQKWCNDLRLLVESDKRSLEEVRQIILWSQQDSFWQAVILSAGSLRKHYPKLFAAYQKSPNKSATPKTPEKPRKQYFCSCGTHLLFSGGISRCGECGKRYELKDGVVCDFDEAPPRLKEDETLIPGGVNNGQ